MKTIFVTVAEFLENGGELNVDREIYREGMFLPEGLFSGFYEYNKDYIVIKTSDFPIPITMALVKILCTPIYS